MSDQDRIAALEKENSRLQKLNDLKSNWISISAHQLRTSLSAIKWILKMFLDGDFGQLNGDQKSFMQKAYDSNERMVEMVTEMLTLNHTDSVALTYSYQPRDLLALVDETMFDFTSESYKKGIQLLFARPSEKIPLIPIDLEKIRVVLQNLIENAIKYSEAGDKVIVSITMDDKNVTVSVKDTGIGIPEAERAKIFEKFFRAENAREKDSIGSGLGLFTSKTIIENHTGKLWFENMESGTNFCFSLPLQQKSS